MVDHKILAEWLKRADEDFEFAASLVEDSPFYAQICFHFHQAVEKYLKTLIIAWDLEFKKIHDLPILLKMCIARKPDLEGLLDDCKLLNGFYIDTRYPVHWPSEYTKEDAIRAMQAADRVRSSVKALLTPYLDRSR